MTFKSHHGRTYHIRAVHVSSNNRRVNVEREQGPIAYEDEDGFQVNGDPFAEPQGEDRASSDSELANSCGSQQRVEHPHLTGASVAYPLQPVLLTIEY